MGDNSGGIMEDEFNLAGIWMGTILLVLLSAVVLSLVIHLICRRRHLHRQQERAANKSSPEMEARVKRRYETIEDWMISKRLLPHDEFCANCVHVLAKSTFGDGVSQLSPTSAASLGTPDSIAGGGGMETGSSVVSVATPSKLECPVCFEEFQVGDIVSFSANSECNHLFHHECIKEWLLRHTGCPFCRKICLHIDIVRGKEQKKQLLAQNMKEYMQCHSQRTATTLCCIQSGLISIPNEVNCTNDEHEELTRRIQDSVVDQATLAKHRKTAVPATEIEERPLRQGDTTRERPRQAGSPQSEHQPQPTVRTQEMDEESGGGGTTAVPPETSLPRS